MERSYRTFRCDEIVFRSAARFEFLSGYLVKGFPPSYSVPTAKVINARILKEFPSDVYGVSICDFVSESLVAKILEANV